MLYFVAIPFRCVESKLIPTVGMVCPPHVLLPVVYNYKQVAVDIEQSVSTVCLVCAVLQREQERRLCKCLSSSSMSGQCDVQSDCCHHSDVSVSVSVLLLSRCMWHVSNIL